jgi:hypothetical protein
MQMINDVPTVMKLRYILLLAMLFVPALHAAHAQSAAKPADTAHASTRNALIYGPLHAFTVRAPGGWTLDTRSGRGQGLQAVFYPNGERWSTSPAVIYCQVVARGKEIRDVKGMLEYDQARYRNSGPGAVVAPQGAITINGGKSASVLRFSGGSNGTFSQTAYIEERAVIVLVNLSCRSSEALERSLPAFSEFLRSYTFLADDEENILRAIEAAELDEE